MKDEDVVIEEVDSELEEPTFGSQLQGKKNSPKVSHESVKFDFNMLKKKKENINSSLKYGLLKSSASHKNIIPKSSVIINPEKGNYFEYPVINCICYNKPFKLLIKFYRFFTRQKRKQCTTSIRQRPIQKSAPISPNRANILPSYQNPS